MTINERRSVESPPGSNRIRKVGDSIHSKITGATCLRTYSNPRYKLSSLRSLRSKRGLAFIEVDNSSRSLNTFEFAGRSKWWEEGCRRRMEPGGGWQERGWKRKEEEIDAEQLPICREQETLTREPGRRARRGICLAYVENLVHSLGIVMGAFRLLVCNIRNSCLPVCRLLPVHVVPIRTGGAGTRWCVAKVVLLLQACRPKRVSLHAFALWFVQYFEDGTIRRGKIN